jgi:hypothetical protein
VTDVVALHLGDRHDQRTHGTPAGYGADGTPVAAASSETPQTGAMIALVPTDADLDRLALAAGEPRDELHLTLFYLGKAADHPPETQSGLVNAIESMIQNRYITVFTTRAFGADLWNPTSDDPAWVLGVGDLPSDERVGEGYALVEVRESVREAWLDGGIDLQVPPQHTPWAPHVCLAYSNDPALLSELVARLGPVTFDRVRIAFANEVVNVPLAIADATLPLSDETTAVVSISPSRQGVELMKTVGDNVTTAVENGTPTDAPASEPGSATDGRTAWRGCVVVEGVTTGDGREFAPNSITWPDPATTIIPLRWNKEDSHGGEKRTLTVNVGRVNELWRDGDKIMGSGTFNVATEDGMTAWSMVRDGYLGGVSIDADDIAEADVEYVWPEVSEDEGSSEEDDLIMILFGAPEKVIFHAGRVRGTTLCDIPAFVEAAIELVDPTIDAQVASIGVQLGAVGSHHTATSDGTWDGSANEKRLPTPVPEAKARAAYGWIDASAVSEGALPKATCKFIHHEVGADSSVGAANMTACSSGIGILHGGRGGTNIPTSDHRGLYDHLASHLRDGGQEPPPFVADGEEAALLAHATSSEWRPSRSWFTDPKFTVASPIIVTDDGRVYGHAVEWGMCHIGYPTECVTAPWEDDHPYFMTGPVICDTGEHIAVGQITCGIGHAPLAWSASRAADHYDNTDYVVADVVVGNDRHGIWVAGAVRPWATERQVHELRASGQVSPDWRTIGGHLRMVGLLTVTASGYQTRRARALVSDGHLHSLISSGFITTRRESGVSEVDLDQRALRLMRDQLAARVGIVRGE